MNVQKTDLHYMKQALRSLALTAALAGSLAGMAQQPYQVTIIGTVSGCTGNSFVNIASLPSTLPAIDIDVPVLPPSCSFSITLDMASQGGGFTISIPCLGAIQSQVVQYQVPPALDSTAVSVTFNCGNSPMDCLGVPGGTALPGTACITFLNQPGTWSANCVCVANGGVVDCEGVLDGPALPGTSCTDPLSGSIGLWNQACTCVTDTFITDCLGIVNGPDMPGTPCTTPNGATGTWNANCACITGTLIYDCLQIPNGPNMPGTPCTVWGTTLTGTWMADCTCDPDTMGGAFDCLGVLNGPNLPGTPCWLFGSNALGTWDAGCDCVPGTSTDCQAGFWAMQAFEWDSLSNPNGTGNPIPYQVWVWNLSSGTGGLTYAWDFGDGTTSNLAYPTHTYSGNGPYLLCLAIADGTGCTDQFCDSVSMDEDGLLEGLVLEHGTVSSGSRQDGFTINVQNPLVMGMSDASVQSQAALWPNPTADELNLALISLVNGIVEVSILDASGRLLLRESRTVITGRNQHSLDTRALPAGVFTLRATDAQGMAISLRFVKQ